VVKVRPTFERILSARSRSSQHSGPRKSAAFRDSSPSAMHVCERPTSRRAALPRVTGTSNNQETYRPVMPWISRTSPSASGCLPSSAINRSSCAFEIASAARKIRVLRRQPCTGSAARVAMRLETKVILYWGFEQGKAAIKASKAASVEFKLACCGCSSTYLTEMRTNCSRVEATGAQNPRWDFHSGLGLYPPGTVGMRRHPNTIRFRS
jgi:hypothetical protein